MAPWVLSLWPDLDTISVRLALLSAVQFGFVAAAAGRLMRDLRR